MATLHIVPHTHWDREWYLPFQEFRIKLVHLVDELLALLDREPGFTRFTLDGQMAVVDDYLEIRPERRAELAARVREGRVLVGPWLVLPDEFLVSPESLVRNLRDGARAARELAGAREDGRSFRMEVGYTPDPFGHVGQLPQILRGFGIDTAVLMRGLGDEPVELSWEAPDGSRVLLAYLRNTYGNAERLPDDPGAFEEAVRGAGRALAPHSRVGQRLLMNGTDHQEPQPRLPELLRKADSGGDVWRISSLPEYLAATRAELEESGDALPVVRGELRDPRRHHLLPGVLSSRTWIKQRNDACERALERWAEPFQAWAELLCADQPQRVAVTGHVATPRVRGAQALLRRAWRLLLECHPHDSICGCSVDAVHDEMRPRFDQCEQIAREVMRQSLVALADEVDTSGLAAHGARHALVAFQPCGFASGGRVRAHLELPPDLDAFELVDAQGRVVPHRELRREPQEIARLTLEPGAVRALGRAVARDGRVQGFAIEALEVGATAQGVLPLRLALCETGTPALAAVRAGADELERALDAGGVERVEVRASLPTRLELEWVASSLPAHGFEAFGLRAARAEAPPALARDAGPDAATLAIGNGILEARAADDGTLELRDARSGRVFPGLAVLRDRGERGDSYTTDPLDEAPPVRGLRDVRVRRERDACGETLVVTGTLRLPAGLAPGEGRTRRSAECVDLPVELRASLAPGVPRLDLDLRLENRARDHRLELCFPTGEPVERAHFDGHFEVVSRPTALPPAAATAGWKEQPRPEAPLRGFVESGPLLVAARGLREAAVAPDGEIALTLLRCFGWLSHDDLRTRAGGAGPHVATPGGQSPGPHRFALAVVPLVGDAAAARREADAFGALPRAVGTRVRSRGGALPARGSLLAVEPAGFRLSAVHLAEDGAGLVARGVLLDAEPRALRLRPLRRPAAARRVRLDERPTGELAIEADGSVRVEARPGEIVSVRFDFDR